MPIDGWVRTFCSTPCWSMIAIGCNARESTKHSVFIFSSSLACCCWHEWRIASSYVRGASASEDGCVDAGVLVVLPWEIGCDKDESMISVGSIVKVVSGRMTGVSTESSVVSWLF